MLRGRFIQPATSKIIKLLTPRTSSANFHDRQGEFDIFRVLSERGIKEGEEGKNAFKLFKLEQKFSISETQLRKEMINLQQQLHPDRYMGYGGGVQMKSEYLSSLVNEQYQILQEPYKRAKYLLSLVSNKDPNELERELDALKMDPDFLTEMMDLQEKIGSRETRQEELARIRHKLEVDIFCLNQELDLNFKERKVAKILPKLGKLKFLSKCLIAVDKRLDEY